MLTTCGSPKEIIYTVKGVVLLEYHYLCLFLEQMKNLLECLME